MSLYHETAEVLSAPASAGGNLKSRVFNNKKLKSPPQQVYALALETCKWSAVLKEVIENSGLLQLERKLTPIVALLLVHDFVVSKKGIALPASHGLRASIERHKARLMAEFTRSRLRRKAPSVDALRNQVERDYLGVVGTHPRWVRVNLLKTTFSGQLKTTFKDLKRVFAIKEVTEAEEMSIYIDTHIPNLVAISPAFEITKTEAYTSGAIILQDKASCFPAYLLDPRPQDGDVIDGCAAPGNKTTHLASIIHSRVPENEVCEQYVFACEKDRRRAKILDKMVQLAGGKKLVRINFGQDFLKLDPHAEHYKNVGALLLDPSCSGSGIVGRDAMPELHLPDAATSSSQNSASSDSRKRKRQDEAGRDNAKVLVDDDGQEIVVGSEKELQARLEALSTFQLVLLKHAFKFPAATKITYSTCSIHAEENEKVVMKALQSDIAKERGWRILPREKQVSGMNEWPLRGLPSECDDSQEVANACIRSQSDDGLGVMGFFVAPFVRDGPAPDPDDDGPFVRDKDGRIIRDKMGMPTLKPTQANIPTIRVHEPASDVVTGQSELAGGDEEMESDESYTDSDDDSDESASGDEDDGDDWKGFED